MQGFDDFIRAVERLGDSMKKKAIAGVIRANLKPVAAAIKSVTPVRSESSHKGTITRYRKNGEISTVSQVGNLKNSIGVKTFSQRDEVVGYAGIMNKKSGKGDTDFDRALNSADGWYGWFLERGTKNIQKNPFISMGAAHSVPQATENLGTDIANYITKNGQKIGLDIKTK